MIGVGTWNGQIHDQRNGTQKQIMQVEEIWQKPENSGENQKIRDLADQVASVEIESELIFSKKGREQKEIYMKESSQK